MQIKQFRYGADNLGYLVYGEKSAAAIDGGAAAAILSFLEEQNLTLAHVTNTHSHMDHLLGNQALLDQSDASYLDFDALMASPEIEIDGESLGLMHTPGHTRDSVCFYFDHVLISGDTLFNGKVGRCFTGDVDGFFQSIQKILAFSDDTRVYAGHDYVEEYMGFARALEPDNSQIDRYLAEYDPAHVCTTLGEEKQVDPFLRFNDEKIINILQQKGLSTETELDRWRSLISLM
ncbi:MAG: hydroxyacylglutathione hydrolase C-terminal domain-containing protein [Desulfobacterales bacterium]|nr:hydroxyacylglutathione hydrolase C-terminal domain-containing protein [Desulfobacterales bacterium]